MGISIRVVIMASLSYHASTLLDHAYYFVGISSHNLMKVASMLDFITRLLRLMPYFNVKAHEHPQKPHQYPVSPHCY